MSKTLVALCCLSASLASQAVENHDGVALLQSQIEEKLVAHQTATVDSEASSAYNVASAFECTTKDDKVVDSDVPEVVASETTSQQPISAHTANSSDPPGASSTRAILRLMCLLLLLDGLRRWWLQKHQTSVPKQQISIPKAQADTQDAEVMKNSWAEVVIAAKNGDESRFKKASIYQSTVTASDPWGCTALHFAAVGGSATIAQELLKYGAEVDALDADDETPLHFAARAGHTRICEVLVTSGAKVDVVNKKGLTPFVVAGESNQEQACCFLADHGAGVAGLADEELPPLVVSQIVRKMFAA